MTFLRILQPFLPPDFTSQSHFSLSQTIQKDPNLLIATESLLRPSPPPRSRQHQRSSVHQAAANQFVPVSTVEHQAD